MIIVGAGPTGLTLANLLSAYGTPFLLVERNSTTVEEPRAVSIDDESLRTLQAAGVVDRILPNVVAGYGSIYYRRCGLPFAKVRPTGSPFGYPRRNAFRQPQLEAQLREALDMRPVGEAWFGCRFDGLSQGDTHVEVRLTDAQDRARQISCDYLVGCDGANSAVRSALGIELAGTSYARRWLIVDLEDHPNETKDTEVFCDFERPCITLPGPNATRRFEFELRDDETEAEILAKDKVEELLRRRGAQPEASVRRTAIYRFHARQATRWSSGRVYLAGDAAHLTPPFAGQGMNSGLRDAHNLAWKLAAVVAGKLGPRLLESYEIERRDHVAAMIRLALQMGKVMAPRGRLHATLTQLGFRCLNVLPKARRYVSEMRYRPPPRFKHGFQLPTRAKGNMVGRLFPQPKVRTEGDECRLDDLLGTGMALLVVGSFLPKTCLSALAQPIWNHIGVRRLALVPLGSLLPEAEGWQGAHILESDLADCYPPRAFLLRPDRYVAADFRLNEAAALADEVISLIEETWAPKADRITRASRTNER